MFFSFFFFHLSFYYSFCFLWLFPFFFSFKYFDLHLILFLLCCSLLYWSLPNHVLHPLCRAPDLIQEQSQELRLLDMPGFDGPGFVFTVTISITFLSVETDGSSGSYYIRKQLEGHYRGGVIKTCFSSTTTVVNSFERLRIFCWPHSAALWVFATPSGKRPVPRVSCSC